MRKAVAGRKGGRAGLSESLADEQGVVALRGVPALGRDVLKGVDRGAINLFVSDT